jgi:eukaryotic-like serine/threonine-protein kinase
VAELSYEEAESLTSLLAGDVSPTMAEAIAQESKGNPYLIGELVQYSRISAEAALDTDNETLGKAPDRGRPDLQPEQEGALFGPARPSEMLDRVIRLRISQLPEHAKRLLEVVAVAGQPIGLSVAKPAAKVEAEQKMLALLRARRLVRTRTIGDLVEMEPYHDRVRETVGMYLSPEIRRTHHHELALALEASGGADPQMLTVHFQAAGESAKAGQYAVLAADQASSVLAFETAVRFYRLALELQTEDGSATQKVRTKLGDALSNSGRGAAAAESYLAAAQGVKTNEALELQRRAAHQFLISGHINQGLAVLRGLLRNCGMSLPATPRNALLSLLWWRTWIKLRGHGFREREVASIGAEELLHIDVCWSVVQALGLVDITRAAAFQARHLLLALRSGEKYRISRALAIEAGFCAVAGARRHAQTQKLLDAASALAQQTHQEPAVGFTKLIAGMIAYVKGDWKEARQRLEQAEAFLRERCIGVTWELSTARQMWCISLFFLGELAELHRRLPGLIKNAEERGDLWEGTDLRIRVSYAGLLAEDKPGKAREEAVAAIARWPADVYLVPHWWSLIAQAKIALYSGQGAVAWKLVTDHWPLLERSLLLRVQPIAVDSFYHRACAALARSNQRDVPTADRRTLIAEAERAARKIERERASWGIPLAHVVRAAIAVRRGNRDRALALLNSAEAGFETAHMGLLAAAARRRRGELIGGDQGSALVQAAADWMKAQSVVNPQRMTNALIP